MRFNLDADTLRQKARRIRLLLLDVDGVLTDGCIYMTAQGEEMKVFNTLDGHGIKQLQRAGVAVGLVSGRDSAALVRRATDLAIGLVYRGREDKLVAIQEILADRPDLTLEAVAYAGDDVPDLPAITAVGLGITVPNAHASVRAVAQLETERPGGHGAVRDICDFLLAAREA